MFFKQRFTNIVLCRNVIQRTIPLSAGILLVLVDTYLIAKTMPSVKTSVLKVFFVYFLITFGIIDIADKNN